MTVSSTGPATYLELDGTEVSIEDAKATWTPIAKTLLTSIAGTYNETITSSELADHVQETSGIRTKRLAHYWIGDVLGRVSAQCAADGKPLLSSLCVQRDGTVVNSYAAAVQAAYGIELVDVEQHAAEERLRCYQAFGATLPTHGGRATFTPQVAQRRTTQERRARAEAPKPTCPVCMLELPRTGVCENCW